MHKTHELAAHYDRLRHELDSVAHAASHEASTVDRLIQQLDQAHADYAAAYRVALGDRAAAARGGPSRAGSLHAGSSHAHPALHSGDQAGQGTARTGAQVPAAGAASGEGPAQPGALPAHWASA